MSKSGATGSVRDRFSVTSRALADRQRELDGLMDRMDELQDDVDQLARESAALKQKHIHLKDEAHKRKISAKNRREAQLFERPETTSARIDLSELSEEHAYIIKNLENSIFDLTRMCEESRQRVENEEAELQSILEEHARLESLRASSRMKVEQEIRGLKEEAKLKKDEIASVDADIRAVQRLMDDTEVAAAAIKERWAVVNESSIAVADARKRVESLDRQIADLTVVRDDLEYQLQELGEQKQRNAEEYKEQSDRIKKLLPWGDPKQKPTRQEIWNRYARPPEDEIPAPRKAFEGDRLEASDVRSERSGLEEQAPKKSFIETERDRLEAEVQLVTNELAEARKENDEMVKLTEKLKKRYADLAPIAKKWRQAVRQSGDDDDLPSIDELLKKHRKISKSVNEDVEDRQADLSLVDLDIMTLEDRIDRKTSWLEKQMDAFKKKKAELKKQIAARRTEAFNRERDIVENIKQLRIREAQRKMSRK